MTEKAYTYDSFFIPSYMWEGIDLYIRRGVKPGSFLSAVIANDLREAVNCADQTNMRNLPAYVAFFYNEAPRHCWGSPEAMVAWMVCGGLEAQAESVRPPNLQAIVPEAMYLEAIQKLSGLEREASKNAKDADRYRFLRSGAVSSETSGGYTQWGFHFGLPAPAEGMQITIDENTDYAAWVDAAVDEAIWRKAAHNAD